MKFFSHGILGMNARNLRYIKTKNTSEWISLADSKLKTKHFLSSRWIPFAETFFTITSQKDLNTFSLRNIKADNFVIKPNKWSGWKGILIVKRNKDQFLIQDEIWTEDEIRLHMIDILHGSYSLHGSDDTVVIEELLTPGADFAYYCRYGLADIRIIVYNYIPITAMIRLPTVHSGGKANLAQWGIGLWLNIANGEVISLFQNKRIHTANFPPEYDWLQWKILPYWDDILLYSSQVQMYTKLGYLALDWVITKNWPRLLEINARAWLEIQNVNLVPLASRLKKVEDLKILSPEKWVEIAKTLFHTETLMSSNYKKIVYLEQKWILWDREVTIYADTTSKQSSISKDLLKYIIDKEISFITDTQVQVVLKDYLIREDNEQKIILWTEILKDYLIDPTIYTGQTRKNNEDGKWTQEILWLDDDVYKLWKKVNLSSLLKPDNYFEALGEFISHPGWYNPVFRYHFPHDDKILWIKDTLKLSIKKAYSLKQSGFVIADLYIEKLSEIENKLWLVEAYKNEDFAKIEQYNSLLFWKTDNDLLLLAKEKVLSFSENKHNDVFDLGKILSLDEILIHIHTYFETHNIKKIPITIESGNLSRMSVSYGKDVKIHISKNAIIREKEMKAILSHEIGTHFQRYLRGRETWLKLFQYGTGYYLSDEEWFAIHRSFAHLPEWYEKNAMYAKYYLLSIADTLSFSELIDHLRMIYPDKSFESLFSDAVRFKRWIIHTATKWIHGTTYQKDKIYLAWYMHVKHWIDDGGDITKLFYGKIKIQDLKILELL